MMFYALLGVAVIAVVLGGGVVSLFVRRAGAPHPGRDEPSS
jgi:hypothetical protein